MSQSVQAFDFDADYGRQYDQFIRQIIPGYESYFELCLALFTESMGTRGSLLVAGCGTGSELVCFAREKPGWNLTGVDLSPQMLEFCRLKLAGVGLVAGTDQMIRLIAGDVAQLPREEFDGITSNLVMHFVRGEKSKLEFLLGLKNNLKPGGLLVLMDACWEKGSGFQRVMRAWWEFGKARGLTKEKWLSFREDFEKGLHPLTKDQQEKLLHQAGFHDVYPFWSSLHHQAFVARNPLA
jgi:tRNA (cmo5U34)-methyltransferase